MQIRLWLLNFALRLTIKRMLSRAKEPAKVREHFEKDAQRFFPDPDGAHFMPDSVKRDAEGDRLALLWASVGRPDRHRVILFLHGGAYIAGSTQTHRHLAARLAAAAGCRAVLPEYRLAPDHRFPAAVDDTELAYRHLLTTGYDPASIALAGDSAGGGLVFALLLRLQSQNLPAPGCVVGFSPWVDMTGQSESLTRNALRDVMLPARRFADVVEFYLGPNGDPTLAEASPVLGDFKTPPPALIFGSTTEILEGDARSLADRMRDGGGDVYLEIWKNMPHAWPLFAGLLRQSDDAVARAGAFIERHLAASDWQEEPSDPAAES